MLAGTASWRCELKQQERQLDTLTGAGTESLRCELGLEEGRNLQQYDVRLAKCNGTMTS